MNIENQFYYGVWLIPLLVIFLTAYSRSVITFLIGLLVSIFSSYSLYVNYKYIPFLSESQTLPLSPKWVDAHRSFVIIDVTIIGTFIILLYSLFLGVVFWNIFSKSNKTKISFKDFSKTSTFYFILFIGTIGNIILSSYFTYSHVLFLSILFCIPFLFIALVKKYPSKK